MDFLRQLLFGPLTMAWAVVNGVITVLSFFGAPHFLSKVELTLAILCIALFTALIVVIIRAYGIHRNARLPVSVRNIVSGTHYYKGNVVLILNKSNWIEAGQILVLFQFADEVQIPLALLSVETFTTDKYPQCVVVATLSDQELQNYLSDTSRWKSMFALPDIKMNFLRGNENA